MGECTWSWCRSAGFVCVFHPLVQNFPRLKAAQFGADSSNGSFLAGLHYRIGIQKDFEITKKLLGQHEGDNLLIRLPRPPIAKLARWGGRNRRAWFLRNVRLHTHCTAPVENLKPIVRIEDICNAQLFKDIGRTGCLHCLADHFRVLLVGQRIVSCVLAKLFARYEKKEFGPAIIAQICRGSFGNHLFQVGLLDVNKAGDFRLRANDLQNLHLCQSKAPISGNKCTIMGGQSGRVLRCSIHIANDNRRHLGRQGICQRLAYPRRQHISLLQLRSFRKQRKIKSRGCNKAKKPQFIMAHMRDVSEGKAGMSYWQTGDNHTPRSKLL